jgi:hypothetical protein
MGQPVPLGDLKEITLTEEITKKSYPAELIAGHQSFDNTCLKALTRPATHQHGAYQGELSVTYR